MTYTLYTAEEILQMARSIDALQERGATITLELKPLAALLVLNAIQSAVALAAPGEEASQELLRRAGSDIVSIFTLLDRQLAELASRGFLVDGQRLFHYMRHQEDLPNPPTIHIGQTGGFPVVLMPLRQEPYTARQFWVFLVENLQPGFDVSYGDHELSLQRQSNQKVPTSVYTMIMGLDDVLFDAADD